MAWDNVGRLETHGDLATECETILAQKIIRYNVSVNIRAE